MALNIKNPEVERLAAQVAEMANESKTEAIRVALEERASRLKRQGRKTKHERVMETLERIWNKLPPEELGRRLTKEEEEEILGFGPDGV
jgi:antitoxin VapB